MFRAARRWPNGNDRQAHQAGDIISSGATRKRCESAPGGDNQLLGHQLDGVGDGLQQAGLADFRRAGAALEPAGAFALDPDQVGGVQADKGQDADQEQHEPERLGPPSGDG